jgi:hypothetical protein
MANESVTLYFANNATIPNLTNLCHVIRLFEGHFGAMSDK